MDNSMHHLFVSVQQYDSGMNMAYGYVQTYVAISDLRLTHERWYVFLWHLCFCVVAEELGLGNVKARCLPYVTFFSHPLVFINFQQVSSSQVLNVSGHVAPSEVSIFTNFVLKKPLLFLSFCFSKFYHLESWFP